MMKESGPDDGDGEEEEVLLPLLLPLVVEISFCGGA